MIFTKSKRSAERVFGSVQCYLTIKLRLVVNLEKSRIVPTSELEYLGFSFVGSRATINVSSKSIERFKHRIREITGRSRGISMERRVGELQRFVRGWMGYYGIAGQLKLFARLEQCRVISCGRPGPSPTVLLLEKLATCSHAGSRVNSTGCFPSSSDPSRQESQGALAYV